MDTVKKLIISAMMLIIPLSVHAQSAAGREIANIQSWLNEGGQGYYKPGTGEQWVRNSANGDRFVKVESTIDYKASNGRNYPVVIEKTGQIDGTKIGKAVVRMAKFLPPVALGVEVYNLVCELSNVCKSQDTDTWEYTSNGVTSTDAQATGWCSQDLALDLSSCLHQYVNCGYKVIGGITNSTRCDNFSLVNNGLNLTFQKFNEFGQLTGSGSLSRQAPYQDQEEIQRPPTDQDWTNAEPLLNDERFDEPLLVNGQPVPLANLPILGNVPPITLSDTETINRDSQGNVTGTTRTTTTLDVTDSATTERPGSVTGTETTVKTDYDTSGQTTGTQTSTNTPPPPDKPQEPPTISFDNAEGLPIETEVVNLQLPAAVSWGEGTCPADVPLPFNNLSIPYQPACDAAMQLRPVVIFLASISALLIISGLRESKS